MDDELKRLKIAVEQAVLKTLCHETDIPEEIWIMMDSFLEAGCPLKSVLEGMANFGQRLSNKKERDDLKELLKDLPIKFEEE